MFDRTQDPKHLEYEKAFQRKLRKKGRENPEIRMNYYLEDIVETGNFVSRERFLSCGRPSSKRVSARKLYFGADWARKSDHTWFGVVNEHNDLVDMIKIPHVQYERQIQLLNDWLRQERTETLEDGTEAKYTYEERILAAKGDSTGQGDMPMETLERQTRLPISESSHVKFTMQSKDQMYRLLDEAIYKDPDDPMRFSYPADHPRRPSSKSSSAAWSVSTKGRVNTSPCMIRTTIRRWDDAPDMVALAVFARADGEIAELY